MTCPRFCSSPSIWIKPAALFCTSFLISSCSIFNAQPDSTPGVGKEQVKSPTRERSSNRVRISQFEWAVQSFEAGDYAHAVKQFKQLEKEGAKVADFELVPYYLGMSYFNAGFNREAAAYLERFLQVGQNLRESQDARMALLLIYERLNEWPRALGLAAETEHSTLFQNNRALLKLIWARALIETNEVLGAKAQLKDATQYLDLTSGEDRTVLSESERDVWGRYHFTSLLVQERECQALNPQKAGSGKRAKTLYTNWLEGSIDCVRQAITEASNEIFIRESAWSVPSYSSLERSMDNLAAKIRQFLESENKVLSNKQALKKAAQAQLYRLITELDKNIKVFKIREVNSQYLESLRKRVDLLLVSISRPS
ncbi:MAG: tetratricopeptide repeat protein [Bdellovibrionota bacterium]